MNTLLIGAADKTDRLLALAPQHFLLIDDGPIADAFLTLPRTKLFDVTQHCFDPLLRMDTKRARDFATTLYTASPEGKETLTVRNGRRALVRLLLEAPTRLDRLSSDDTDPGTTEALATVQDVLLSPLVRQVLCGDPNFKFTGRVVLRLDRAMIGDFDAFVLACLAIQQFKGQIIVPDGGFYIKDIHMSLIRQNRLTVGLQYLSELPPSLRQAVLLIKDKTGSQCTFEDAETLASYAGKVPNTQGHTDFITSAME